MTAGQQAGFACLKGGDDAISNFFFCFARVWLLDPTDDNPNSSICTLKKRRRAAEEEEEKFDISCFPLPPPTPTPSTFFYRKKGSF
jgi:hypothetical protein